MNTTYLRSDMGGQDSLYVFPLALLICVAIVVGYQLRRICRRVCAIDRETRNVEEIIDECRLDQFGIAEDYVIEVEGVERNMVQERLSFSALLVQEAKNRFGCPERNKANELAVRKFLLDAMVRRNVRPSHINMMLPACIEMVFIQNDAEALGARIAEVWADRNSSTIARWIRWVLRCGRRTGTPLRSSTL